MGDIRERVLTAEEKNHFVYFSKLGTETLSIPNAQIEPEQIMQSLDSHIDKLQAALRAGPRVRTDTGQSLDQLALGIGLVFGDQLVRRFGWEWTCIVRDGKDYYAVVTLDRSLVDYPVEFIKACLDDADADCTAMLAFNMLAGGRIKGLPAYGYENLMLGVHRIVPKR